MNINKVLANQATGTMYGAAMGRRDFYQLTADKKVLCQVVAIDSQGYDRGGAYWGIAYDNKRLYCVFQPDGDLRVFIRAIDNATAREQVMDTVGKHHSGGHYQ